MRVLVYAAFLAIMLAGLLSTPVFSHGTVYYNNTINSTTYSKATLIVSQMPNITVTYNTTAQTTPPSNSYSADTNAKTIYACNLEVAVYIGQSISCEGYKLNLYEIANSKYGGTIYPAYFMIFYNNNTLSSSYGIQSYGTFQLEKEHQSSTNTKALSLTVYQIDYNASDLGRYVEVAMNVTNTTDYPNQHCRIDNCVVRLNITQNATIDNFTVNLVSTNTSYDGSATVEIYYAGVPEDYAGIGMFASNFTINSQKISVSESNAYQNYAYINIAVSNVPLSSQSVQCISSQQNSLLGLSCLTRYLFLAV